MKDLLPFTFPTTGQTVRTLLLDGDEPWFVAADVTDILGYANGRAAVQRHVDEDDRREYRRSEAVAFRYPFDDLRIQSVSLINESGLFSLILRSDVLGAREFKRWVTSEVLPTIRKTGTYSVAELSRKQLAQMVIDAEEALEAERNARALAECQVLDLAPAAYAWDELVEGHGDYDVAQAAIILNRDRSIKTGQRRLFDYMASIGWIYRKHGRWTPYQEHVENGRLVAKPQSHRHPDDDELVIIDAPQVRVTVKGLGELHRLLGGGSQLPALVSEGVAA